MRRPLTLLGVLLACAGSASRPPACPYPQVQPTVRRLLLGIDQQLPRVLAAFSTPADSSTYDLPEVDITQCFEEIPATRAFTFGPFYPHARPQVLSHLRHNYHKDMGSGLDPGGPHAFGVSVLAYDTPAAAAAAKQALDLLVASCDERPMEYHERCAGIEGFRVSRHGAVLLRYSCYSNDPIQRRNLRGLASQLSQATGLVPNVRPARVPQAGRQP